MGLEFDQATLFSAYVLNTQLSHIARGVTTAEKLRETKVWVPTPERLRPGVGCARGSHPPAVSVRKICENSDAKSYILVTTCEIFLLFENYGQEVGGTNTLLVPNLNVGGPVFPGPYGCCAYADSHIH